MSGKRVWLIDGHNMIFAIHDLRLLHDRGRREDARQVLTDQLEIFAQRQQQRVVVVFDNRTQASGPVRRLHRDPRFEVVYAPGGQGAADEFIVREARRCCEAGVPVTVVSNDVRTLAVRLPRAVQHRKVPAFLHEHLEPPPAEDEMRVGGDFSDIEREILAHAAALERSNPMSRPALVPPPLRAAPQPAPAGGAGPETRRLKRERGRLRQERRLKRRSGRAG